MLVYKCDGESYTTGKKCQSEAEDDLPEWWLLITGRIRNGLHDAHYIESNGTKHFCSRGCLMAFLFKDVNPAGGQSSVDNMLHDPNVKAAETNEQATEQQAAAESAAQDSATGATENAEEGGVEG